MCIFTGLREASSAIVALLAFGSLKGAPTGKLVVSDAEPIAETIDVITFGKKLLTEKY